MGKPHNALPDAWSLMPRERNVGYTPIRVRIIKRNTIAR